jgi:hypothetical protein
MKEELTQFTKDANDYARKVGLISEVEKLAFMSNEGDYIEELDKFKKSHIYNIPVVITGDGIRRLDVGKMPETLNVLMLEQKFTNLMWFIGKDGELDFDKWLGVELNKRFQKLLIEKNWRFSYFLNEHGSSQILERGSFKPVMWVSTYKQKEEIENIVNTYE